MALLRAGAERCGARAGGDGVEADDEALATIASYSSGDARNALNALEVAAKLAEGRGEKVITKALAAEAMQRRVLLYDKKGEQHYDMISALHKSVRNSDADAALYWLGRMLEAGEDPMYVARRVVRMAVEDIGLAAPEALNLCLSARDAMHFLGHPEGELALAQAVVYLALAPKSNAVYTAYGAVQADIEATAAEPVPLHLRNAPTKLMKELDYGQGLSVRARCGGRWRIWSVCRRGWRGGGTISRRMRGGRSCWRSGWRRLRGSRQRNEVAVDSIVWCFMTVTPVPLSRLITGDRLAVSDAGDVTVSCPFRGPSGQCLW